MELKKRFNVGFATEKPPHNHNTTVSPTTELLTQDL